MGQVLGIAVVDRQIASVVHDADGKTLASNLVELDAETPAAVEAAIVELVESVPYHVDSIGVACADAALTEILGQRFVLTPGRPTWYELVTVSDVSPALAQVAVTQANRPGSVAMVNLDESSAPTPGLSIAIVDTATGMITAQSHFDTRHSPDDPSAVVDPAGANTVAGAIAALPGGDAVTSVICTGPGAQIPGVAPAFEYAMQRPVQIATEPVFAIASGAAAMSQQTPVARPVPVDGYDRANRRRWWLIGASVAASLFVAAIAAAAVLFGTGTAQRVVEGPTLSVTTETVTQTPERVTVTEAGPRRTTTSVRTVTPKRTTVTQTSTETTTVTDQGGPTVTQTETATVTTTVTKAQPGASGADFEVPSR